MPTPKKRNPTDATLRNVRSASGRTKALEARVKKLEQRIAKLEWKVRA